MSLRNIVFMKKITFMLVCFFSISILTTSCNRNGCTDPDAANYEDKAKKDDNSCTYDREDMIAFYGILENCNDEGSWNYTLEISDHSSDKTKIILENIGGWSNQVNIEATVDGDSFSFNETVDEQTFIGSGTITDANDLITISIEYDITENGVTKTCNANGSKL